MKMANLVKWLLPALALAALTNYAWAQTSTSGTPGYKAELTKVQATVQSIDPKTREVTVVGPKGPVSIYCGPEVKNFDNLKVGDKVNLSFYQESRRRSSRARRR